MSDAQADWDGASKPKEPEPGSFPEKEGSTRAPDATFAGSPAPDEVADFIMGPALEPADESPTIISRTQRGRPEEGIIPSLRGRRLAHFELLEAIGVGGMAAVIRARDTQLDRLVALKILPPTMAADPESIRRFHHEARAAAKLDHENIARVFYCGEDQGLHFIAFEFVEGDNLRMILDRRGRLPVPEVIQYVLQVATGLAHASSRGVVHRDIKPSNIIITPTGRAKLVDMGLARSLGPQADDALTQSGVTLGTFDYISPEQALEPREADVRSDIYSLGCTLYHLLTGYAPVPEGTAARKLHHHQHVPPIDPRQLNPAIADELAAVLAKMMAKDPKDRYQRPEHLVQHLLQLAQKVGAGHDLPEGVLFVDAPLPAPPRLRPLLVGSIAVGILVALVAILSSLPGSGTNPDFQPVVTAGPELPPIKAEKEGTGTGPTPAHLNVPNPPPVVKARKQIVRTSKELAEALKLPAVHIELGADHFELRVKPDDLAGEGPGLFFRGTTLVIEPEDPGRRPTIHLKYDATASRDLAWTALTVASERLVTLRNLNFHIDPNGTSTPMAAVAREGGRLRVENCEFIQTGLPEAPGRPQVSSVQVGPSSRERTDAEPDVSFERCYFAGGDRGLLFTALANVQLRDCAFGPHWAACHFRGSKVEDAELSLQCASVMLASNSSAFLLTDDASARLFVSHSVFADVSTALPSGSALIRQAGTRLGRFRFEPEYRNVYHKLGAFWVQGQQVRAATLQAFRFAPGVGRNDRSIELTQDPWAIDQPRPNLAEEPGKAFQLNLLLPELRQSNNQKRMIGVTACTWGNLYAEPLPEVRERPMEPLARNEKIVDPTVKRSSDGRYPTLSQAVGDAQPKDVILIKHNGPLPVAPLRLEDHPNLELTVRPFEGYHPILTLGATTDPDPAMFRLSDGKLTLENLEFHLPNPPRNDFRAQSLVLLTGEGECLFRKCLITVEETKDVPICVFTLADPNSVMKKDPKTGVPQGGPKLRLETSFVRGEGDLIMVRGSQACTIDLEDDLLALDGSLLIVDGNPKEPPTKPPVHLVLNRVTAYLADHLVLLRACEAKPMAGLVPTLVQASNSVFMAAKPARRPAAEEKALVHLEGIDSDEQMKRLFAWGEGKQNVYSGYGNKMLEQYPRPDNMATLTQLDGQTWQKYFPRETEGRFEKIELAGWSSNEEQLARALAVQFKFKKPELPGCGPDVDRLPRPGSSSDLPDD